MIDMSGAGRPAGIPNEHESFKCSQNCSRQLRKSVSHMMKDYLSGSVGIERRDDQGFTQIDNGDRCVLQGYMTLSVDLLHSCTCRGNVL